MIQNVCRKFAGPRPRKTVLISVELFCFIVWLGALKRVDPVGAALPALAPGSSSAGAARPRRRALLFSSVRRTGGGAAAELASHAGFSLLPSRADLSPCQCLAFFRCHSGASLKALFPECLNGNTPNSIMCCSQLEVVCLVVDSNF